MANTKLDHNNHNSILAYYAKLIVLYKTLDKSRYNQIEPLTFKLLKVLCDDEFIVKLNRSIVDQLPSYLEDNSKIIPIKNVMQVQIIELRELLISKVQNVDLQDLIQIVKLKNKSYAHQDISFFPKQLLGLPIEQIMSQQSIAMTLNSNEGNKSNNVTDAEVLEALTEICTEESSVNGEVDDATEQLGNTNKHVRDALDIYSTCIDKDNTIEELDGIKDWTYPKRRRQRRI